MLTDCLSSIAGMLPDCLSSAAGMLPDCLSSAGPSCARSSASAPHAAAGASWKLTRADGCSFSGERLRARLRLSTPRARA